MIELLSGPHALVAVLAGGYGATCLSGASILINRKRALVIASTLLLAVAFALNTFIIVDRWIEGGRPPFKTLFETMLFYPWCVGLLTFVLLFLHRVWFLIPFSAAISLAGLIYALARPDVEIVNLPPALQSGWFVPHVVTYFVAYAALFLSGALAFLALFFQRMPAVTNPATQPAADPVAPHQIETPADLTPPPADAPVSRLTALRAMPFDRIAHHAAIFGFCALTFGLVMGAAWGKFAWGDYWQWDIKENWALVTWLAYSIYVHLRLLPHWNGRRAMIILVLAFGAVVFTYLGMNLLPTPASSLHTYSSNM